MTTQIFYFTGTGNSLSCARQLVSELGEGELISVEQALAGTIRPSADKIGIVFPVYMWGLPLIITRFIELLSDPNAYYFAVANCGGMPGATLDQLKKLIEKQKCVLSCGFSVTMPGNYTPMYGAFSKARQKKIFDKAHEKIMQIAAKIKEKAVIPVEKSNFIVNRLLSKYFYQFAAPKIPAMDRQFWVDNKCTSCGVCVRVCPNKNIRLDPKKPVWDHHCEQCLRCLQWCPIEAIQFGNNTVGRKRYRHQDITLDDILKGIPEGEFN